MLDPRSPRLRSTTDQLETKQHNEHDFHRAPTWSQLRHLHWYQWHLQLVLEVICESRGLSNLTPSRSRLFKLIGRVKGMRWSCSKRLAYLVANIRKWEREEKAKARSNNYDQEVILEQPTSSITPTTVFTSRTPPERDHHGYTRGWCILIKVNFRFSTTGH